MAAHTPRLRVDLHDGIDVAVWKTVLHTRDRSGLTERFFTETKANQPTKGGLSQSVTGLERVCVGFLCLTTPDDVHARFQRHVLNRIVASAIYL